MATTRCRSARRKSSRKGAQLTIVTYGTMVYVCEAAARSLGLDARSSTCARWCRSTWTRSARRSRDRPLPDRARGDALLRLRRRALGHDPGAVLLDSRGADPARRRLGHAVSARVRVGVFPGARARDHRPQGRDGDAMTRYVFKMPDLGEGTVEAEIVRGTSRSASTSTRTRSWRGHDREGRGRSAGAGDRSGRIDDRWSRRHDPGRRRADRVRDGIIGGGASAGLGTGLCACPDRGETGLSPGEHPAPVPAPHAQETFSRASRDRCRRSGRGDEGRDRGEEDRADHGLAGLAAPRREAGIDLAQVGGSGPGGRIPRDLEAALSGAAAAAAPATRDAKPSAVPGLARRTAPRRSRSSACDA